MNQIKEIHDGSRDVVRIWENEQRFTIVAVVRPADMTKTDLATQTYVDLPRKYANETCQTILDALNTDVETDNEQIK